MSDWAADELARIGRANELRIASGGVTKDVTIADGSALDRSEVDAAYRAKFGSSPSRSVRIAQMTLPRRSEGSSARY